MDIFEDKALFVKRELYALLKRIDPDINSVSYHCEFTGTQDRSPSHEYVLIIWELGGTRTVNVTGDSLLGITRDVMKYIE